MKKQDPKHLIFLHLPKNGGSTIQSILNRIFKKEETFTVHWVGTKGNLHDFIEMDASEREKIKLLKGHFGFGLDQHFQQDTTYFTFLRRPEERIISFYYYVKRSKRNRLYQLVQEGNMSFRDFVELDDKDGNNGQIRKLSGINSDETSMLDTARKNIEGFFPVVGIQELFDESLIVLAYHFSWPMPFYKTKNVSKNKKEVSQEDRDLLAQRNQGDIALYEEMRSRLEQQMKEIPFFKLRLFTLRTINKIISIF